jgi:anti-sigma B factor antagonist
MSLPLFAVSAMPDRERVRVLAAGELDLSTCDALRRQIAELLNVGWRDITVDLREVTFIDTAGVHVLLAADRRAHDDGARLTVVAEAGPVRSLLGWTATDAVLSLA